METDEAIYFYGVSNKFNYFSNFYMVNFTENNITFCCSEQYFMYYKCLTFDKTNKKLLNAILNETSAIQIKKYGRQVKNYDEKIWNDLRYQIMVNALHLKFSQNNIIKEKLLETKNKILYEASKNDKIWGIGYSVQDAILLNKNTYGQNLLGKALMEVRDKLLIEIINK